MYDVSTQCANLFMSKLHQVSACIYTHDKSTIFYFLSYRSPVNAAAFVINSDHKLNNKKACSDISKLTSLVDVVLHGCFS